MSGKSTNVVEIAKQRMSSSLLRMIDESFYTTESSKAEIDKDSFLSYHKAYSEVSKKWPLKPIEFIIKFLKKRKICKKPLHKIKFADIGCGPEPMLKKLLPRGVDVKSYDIISTHKDIIAANMSKLPLDDSSIDCAVYSLSLMALDLGNILLEAKRILKVHGSLIIVEVTSRFEKNEKKFVGQLKRIGLVLSSSKGLPPNSYFTFFHFKKNDAISEYPKAFINIQLKPCIYRPR